MPSALRWIKQALRPSSNAVQPIKTVAVQAEPTHSHHQRQQGSGPQRRTDNTNNTNTNATKRVSPFSSHNSRRGDATPPLSPPHVPEDVYDRAMCYEWSPNPDPRFSEAVLSDFPFSPNAQHFAETLESVNEDDDEEDEYGCEYYETTRGSGYGEQQRMMSFDVAQ